MRHKRIWLSVLIVLIVSAGALYGLAVYQLQPKPRLPHLPVTPSELENFFGDSSCSWPCWQGITPGVTAGDDALQLLQNSALVSQSTVQTESSKTGFGTAHWEWKIGPQQPTLSGDMEWRDGIVRNIGLGAYPIFSLGEIIDRFGPPEKVDVIDCTEIPEGKYRYLCGTLYYTKSGFEIHIDWQVSWNDKNIQITPSNPIDFVVLLRPSTIEEWVTSYGGDPQKLNLQEWKGYGNLYDLYFR